MNPVGLTSQIQLDAVGDLALLAKHDMLTAPAAFFLTGKVILPSGDRGIRATIRGVGQKVLDGADIPLLIRRAVNTVDPRFLEPSVS
jgi:hypothetical protein